MTQGATDGGIPKEHSNKLLCGEAGGIIRCAYEAVQLRDILDSLGAPKEVDGVELTLWGRVCHHSEGFETWGTGDKYVYLGIDPEANEIVKELKAMARRKATRIN